MVCRGLRPVALQHLIMEFSAPSLYNAETLVLFARTLREKRHRAVSRRTFHLAIHKDPQRPSMHLFPLLLPGCDAQNATCLQLVTGRPELVCEAHTLHSFDHRSYYSNVAEPTPSECRFGSALRRCIHAFSGLIDFTLSDVFVADNCALQSRLVASPRRGQTVTSKTTQKLSSLYLQNPPGGADR